jgi:hypothetical protein
MSVYIQSSMGRKEHGKKSHTKSKPEREDFFGCDAFAMTKFAPPPDPRAARDGAALHHIVPKRSRAQIQSMWDSFPLQMQFLDEVFPSEPRFPIAEITPHACALISPCPSAVRSVRDRVSDRALIRVNIRGGGYRWDAWINVIRVVIDDVIDLRVYLITSQGIHSSDNTTLWL